MLKRIRKNLKLIRKYGFWRFMWQVTCRTWHLTWHPYSQYPNRWQVHHLMDHCNHNNSQMNIRYMQDGKEQSIWVPARPLGYPSLRNRFAAAYAVFSGKADAVRWPVQEDYEHASTD